MITDPRILLTSALLCVSLSTLSAEEKAPAPSARTNETSPTKPLSPKLAREEVNQFRTATRKLFDERKFAELEAMADKLRSGKELFPGGTWKIQFFYECMDCPAGSSDAIWKAHEQIFHDWTTQSPKSSTAHVAKARFYQKYGWKARGTSFGPEVTEEGWKLLSERLAIARTILDQSKPLKPACPMWWYTYQTVALGQNWERKEYDALFNEAKKFEPGFFPYDTARANYLLPRWNGRKGEWEDVAEKEIPRQGKWGLSTYARVVDSQTPMYGNIFKEAAVSWEKTRAGYDELVARFPQSSIVLNNYCRLSYLAGDRPQTKKLIQLIGNDPDPVTWKKIGFEKVRDWAMSDR